MLHKLSDLKEILAYNPTTGSFTWMQKRGRKNAGDIAGTKSSKGYWQIKVLQTVVEAHRLAWYFTYETWPEHEIDHINLDRADNRIANLRPANRSQNCANSPMRPHNKVGLKGVVQRGHLFAAQITINSKATHLGVFTTAEMAHKAYMEAATAAHGEFARAS